MREPLREQLTKIIKQYGIDAVAQAVTELATEPEPVHPEFCTASFAGEKCRLPWDHKTPWMHEALGGFRWSPVATK